MLLSRLSYHKLKKLIHAIITYTNSCMLQIKSQQEHEVLSIPHKYMKKRIKLKEVKSKKIGQSIWKKVILFLFFFNLFFFR